jgi:hypothetical protein
MSPLLLKLGVPDRVAAALLTRDTALPAQPLTPRPARR